MHNTNDCIYGELKKRHVPKGVQMTFLDPNYSTANTSLMFQMLIFIVKWEEFRN